MIFYTVNGEPFQADEADSCLVALHKWRISLQGYVIAVSDWTKPIHRLVLNAPPRVGVDHKNGDRLDNRRCNLRFANDQQNQWNARTRVDNTSGYKGVTFNKKSKLWQAQIRHQGKNHFLGMYATPELAKVVYERKAFDLRPEWHRSA